MKNILTLILLTLGLAASGQNRKIEFKPDNLNEALTLAKAQHKVVFVDCYTSWCIPCKHMEANVFTVDTVADFFNSTFINMKAEMDKDDRMKALGKTYNIGAYPSYLLLDGDGKLLFKFVGGMSADAFMKKIRSGLKPNNEVAVMDERYESGDRSAGLLRDYALLKVRLQEIPLAKKIDEEFMDRVPLKQIVKKENWALFGKNRYAMYLSEIDTRNFNFLADHWKEFAVENTKDTVDEKLASVYRKIASYALVGYYFKGHPYNKDDFEHYRKQINATDMPDKDQFLVLIDMADAAGKKDLDKVTDLMAKHISGFTEANRRITWDYFTFCSNNRNYKSPRIVEIADLVIKATNNPYLVSTCEMYKKKYTPTDAR
ncbi:thioredoxin fold domain-containing protein [Mucilaginibacter paludis]|uniref:Thioredoxin domain-containing protein n=1 Tax=Mucilaginibacter paludis DSM 18603 TaxID=714943 RepID=H1Y340_9SPHI|nr:thioredoxin fold domain-containing protein [Mucilaginibacter paludis]EHQ28858.1 Thioredoxin domain-containing protein [Mucilaginibacter paludis DSM 18603]